MRKFLAVFLSIYLLFAGLTPARAQSSARLSLFALQTASFPTMTTGLDVFDAAGNFVTGLTPDAVTLLEDNQPRPLTNLEELQPGTEFALALDPGPYFAYRDANAVSRFDKIVQVVKEWAAAHPDSLDDDLSLLPTGGTPATHLATTAAFSDALTVYQPNLQSPVSSPETLSRALDVVSEPTSQTGRKPVVLYITSLPTAGDIPAQQNLTQRAVAGHIRVHVWIVASQDSFSTSGATALKDLAIQTGGQYVLFSGEEPLPSPEIYLAPLRHAYRLAYSSGILTSGGHTLTAQVSLNGETVTSAALPFELEVQPPNPIMVALPVQIVRTAPDERTTAVLSFLPTQQTISIIIEFPDGRTRPLVRTSLYVDGVLADENTAEPFDQFAWDLSGYATSGQHILTVEAVDTFGLSKVSLGVPVLVTVVRPQEGLLPWLSRNSLWVALGAILLAGGGLGAILTRSRVKKRRSVTAGRKSRHDPLTQSVQAEGGKRGLRLLWNRPAKRSGAYLVRLKDDGQPIAAPPIPITMPEITFGSDPIQATHILDDPSISSLHARLKVEHGEYILSDEKSAAGTWINYEQLTTPRHLQHGDVLHIGRLSYRFMLHKPPERPNPQVIPTKK
ncbi:MAG TPA: FHA domain-containing protein [Anaerolineales bacterium]